MTATTPRLTATLAATLAAIDAANSADPNEDSDGRQAMPKELLYGKRMSAWLNRIAPDASEVLQVAARAQHIERWTVPRVSYPAGRDGYHRWRQGLQVFHAKRTGEIMAEQGYDLAAQSRAGELLRKKGLKTDDETQTLENVICLVFLENYFADFSSTLDPDKVVDIVRKTWRKMSPPGHAAALKLELPDEARALVERALQTD